MPYPAAMPPPGKPLTPGEIRVASLVAEGYPNAEIGALLHLSEGTVKTHLRRTFRKVGARDRAHMVAILFAPNGWVVCPHTGRMTPRPAASSAERTADLVRAAAALVSS